MLFCQLKFAVLNILRRLSGAPQIIIGVSLCHKILEGTLLFLRLIVIHMTVKAWWLLLVMHLGNWDLFARGIVCVTSISFL